MRLIDADALKEKILKERDAIPTTRTERYGFGVEFPNHHGESMLGGIRKALRCMEQTPTIDAVPVVQGRWIVLDECSNAGAYCSVCHKKVYKECYGNCKMKSTYCPNCGAKMDLEDTND